VTCEQGAEENILPKREDRQQTAGQSNYIKVANKSFEKRGKVQVFGSNINGP
jgi:hypothetical protein